MHHDEHSKKTNTRAVELLGFYTIRRFASSKIMQDLLVAVQCLPACSGLFTRLTGHALNPHDHHSFPKAAIQPEAS